jgi:putative SOS response-associated peptidase YedK
VGNDKAMAGFWRESTEQRRCLVPASGFCEPERQRETCHVELVRAEG